MADEPDAVEESIDEIKHPDLLLKRVWIFLRSVIPEDPWQLIFLIGVIFLFISPRLSWRNPETMDEVLRQALRTEAHDEASRTRWIQVVTVAVWPIIVAGLIAFYSCFWFKVRSVRRLWLGVVLPPFVSLIVILFSMFLLEEPRRSLFDSSSAMLVSVGWIRANVWRFPTALYICFLATVLITVFLTRMGMGFGGLPISLRPREDALYRTEELWNHSQWLVFILVGPYILLGGFFGVILGLPYLIWGHSLSPVVSVILSLVTTLADGVLLVGVAVVVLGTPSITVLKRSLHWPKFRGIFAGMMIPILISILTSLAVYLYERSQWAGDSLIKLSPPEFANYFALDGLRNPWLILLVSGALAEELVFRGLLLPKMIRHFDLHRGIFLTGIVWAATHFRTDSYSGLNVGWVLYKLIWRVGFCLVLNYVLSWMTLRWRSILPAAIAHTLANVFAVSGFNQGPTWIKEVWIVPWGMTALLLWHYRPMDERETLIEQQILSEPEPVA